MLTLVYSPTAKHDLASIHTASARQFEAGHADLYVRAIDAALQHATEFPKTLRDASEVRIELLKLHTGLHISFVRLIEEVLRVIRILHDRMDPDRWV